MRGTNKKITVKKNSKVKGWYRRNKYSAKFIYFFHASLSKVAIPACLFFGDTQQLLIPNWKLQTLNRKPLSTS